MKLYANMFESEPTDCVNIVILRNKFARLALPLTIFYLALSMVTIAWKTWLLPAVVAVGAGLSSNYRVWDQLWEKPARTPNFVAGFDRITQTIVPLFNPRQQQWSQHFIWTSDGKEILGTTPSGRATCDRLDLNDTRYPESESIRSARELWTRVGLHPPINDPCQFS